MHNFLLIRDLLGAPKQDLNRKEKRSRLNQRINRLKVGSASPAAALHSPGRGQGEEECCALAYSALCPDAAAVPRNHAVHDGKAHAGAAEFFSAVQPLEYAEQSLGVLHVETCAVVLNRVDHFTDGELSADIDERVV